MNNSSIVVIGSTNTDMVIKTDRLPSAGETLLGGSFFMNPGGKGANQAVAAARLGGMVSFICRIGDDLFGKKAREMFDKEGIDSSCIFTDEIHPSGVALITVDKNGENTIVVAPGANATLSPRDLRKTGEKITAAAVLLLQLEISMETVEEAVKMATSSGTRVILNPAPAQHIPREVLENVHILTPNRKEAELLTGIRIDEGDLEAASSAASSLHETGVGTIIITLGSEGALLYRGREFFHVPAPAVKAVDTTAAGDVFNGALAVAIAAGVGMKDAVHFACKAASISVTRLGAQSSAPYHHEID